MLSFVKLHLKNKHLSFHRIKQVLLSSSDKLLIFTHSLVMLVFNVITVLFLVNSLKQKLLRAVKHLISQWNGSEESKSVRWTLGLSSVWLHSLFLPELWGSTWTIQMDQRCNFLLFRICKNKRTIGHRGHVVTHLWNPGLWAECSFLDSPTSTYIF